MKNEWTICVMDKIGFSCYNTMQMLDIADLGDTYNIITTDGDIFLDKEHCYISTTPYKSVERIEYITDTLEVYLEKINDEGVA